MLERGERGLVGRLALAWRVAWEIALGHKRRKLSRKEKRALRRTQRVQGRVQRHVDAAVESWTAGGDLTATAETRLPAHPATWQARKRTCYHAGTALTFTPRAGCTPSEPFVVWAGGDVYFQDVALEDYDIIVPLSEFGAPGRLYTHTKFKGVVLGFPVTDGEAWPADVLKRTVVNVATAAQTSRVFVFCTGGHGRTGTFLAALAAVYEDTDDPIEWVRKRYCEDAVETVCQAEAVWALTGKPMPEKYTQLAIGVVTFGSGRWTPSGTAPQRDWPSMTVAAQADRSRRWQPTRELPNRMALWEQIRRTHEGEDLTFVHRVLTSPLLKIVPGWSDGIWWVYGDQHTGELAWEAFVLAWHHIHVVDGTVTAQYRKTVITPTDSHINALSRIQDGERLYPADVATPPPIADLDNDEEWTREDHEGYTLFLPKRAGVADLFKDELASVVVQAVDGSLYSSYLDSLVKDRYLCGQCRPKRDTARGLLVGRLGEPCPICGAVVVMEVDDADGQGAGGAGHGQPPTGSDQPAPAGLDPASTASDVAADVGAV